jgi:hypothetical protein
VETKLANNKKVFTAAKASKKRGAGETVGGDGGDGDGGDGGGTDGR